MSARLLVLSCSATKRSDAGLLPARQRYDGPLWQSLRVADPDGRLASCFALSARFGLVGSDEGLPDYNSPMTAARAAEMERNPLCSLWGRGELPRQAQETGDRWSASAVLYGAAEALPGRRFAEACFVGGGHYVGVFRAIVRDLVMLGLLDPAGRVELVHDEIGRMRQRMRLWLTGEGARVVPAPVASPAPAGPMPAELRDIGPLWRAAA